MRTISSRECFEIPCLHLPLIEQKSSKETIHLQLNMLWMQRQICCAILFRFLQDSMIYDVSTSAGLTDWNGDRKCRARDKSPDNPMRFRLPSSGVKIGQFVSIRVFPVDSPRQQMICITASVSGSVSTGLPACIRGLCDSRTNRDRTVAGPCLS
jgi:hypothetical protein